MQCKEKASWRKQERVAPTLALVGWVVGCWKLTGGGRCDWIGLMHGEPSNGFPPGRPGCELMNHMLYVYIYIRIHLTTSN